MIAMGRTAFTAVLAVAVVVVGSCAPQQPSANGAPTSQQASLNSAAPKLLNVGRLREPATIEGFTGEGGTAGSAGEVKYFIHEHLTHLDTNDADVPRLAAELPAVDRGTWRANPDGTMDVTWKLRSNVTWHDGAPFTSADLERT